MKWTRVFSFVLGVFVALCLYAGRAGADPFVPFGAYVAWERIVANAAYFNEAPATYLDKLTETLAKGGFNSVWVTNLPGNEIATFTTSASRVGLKPMVNLTSLQARATAHSSSYYASAVPQTLRALGGAPQPNFWVLADEPAKSDRQRVDSLGNALRQQLPGSMRTIVTTYYDYRYYLRADSVDAICVDLYPFFGPNDPNGPNTPDTSKTFFRSEIKQAGDLINHSDKAFWTMVQGFTEVWGPWHYDHNYHVIALPGAYVHWFQPTVPEIRWQFWESLRDGAKGVFYFLATPVPPDPKRAHLPPPKVSWTSALMKHNYDAGPGAILNPDLSPTPQFDAISRLISHVQPISNEILHWHKTDLPITLLSSGSAQGFATPSGKQYVVIVNDNLQKSENVQFVTRKTASTSAIVSRKTAATLHPNSFIGSVPIYDVLLAPGDGVVIEIHS